MVPPAPGLFSAFGLLYADVEHHYVRTWRRGVRAASTPPSLADAFGTGWRRRRAPQLARRGLRGRRRCASRRSPTALPRPVLRADRAGPDGPVDAAWLAALEEAFGREHERTYGHRAGADEPVELVSLRLVAPRRRRRPAARPRPGGAGRDGGPGRPTAPPRASTSGPRPAGCATPILRRADLATRARARAIVEEYDATSVVPPGARAALDAARQHRDRRLMATPPTSTRSPSSCSRTRSVSIADEMALTILRTAYSGVLKDVMDYSTAFCDADGQTVAQGLTQPGAPRLVPRRARRRRIRRYGDRHPARRRLHPQRPVRGRHAPARHLRPQADLRPRGERLAFAATICHQTDVGGRVAGSNASRLDRDLPGGAAHPAPAAVRGRPSRTRRCSA